MDQPELQDQHRGAIASIVDRHGGTPISTLRLIYGADFAPGFHDESRLGSVALLLDDPSLAMLVKDHVAGALIDKIGVA